ncbi:ESPR-type extended signal peptide-containing protein [Ursidibacter sp. B-7004-1]
MNKVFKVIWNYSTQSWVAVSELAKGHTKSSSTNTNNISEVNLDYPNTGKAASATVIGAALAVTVLTSAWSPTAYAGASINQGDGAKATGQDSIAIGTNANSSGTNATAIGNGALANKADTIAFGSGAGARGDSAVSVGKGSSANATNSTAIGVSAKATGNNSTAIGLGTQAKNENALAIGTNSTADNKNTVAIGYKAQALNEGAFAFGTNVSSQSNGSLGLGTDSVASGTHSVAVGTNAKTKGGTGSIAFGLNAAAGLGPSIAFGANSTSGEDGSAFGANTTAGRWASAFGSNATASGTYSVASGNNATASGSNSVASGNNATASGSSAVAVGRDSVASGTNATALGYQANASAANALAFGAGAKAATTNSVALGNGSTASASNALAFGNGANASTANSVALGNGAETSAFSAAGALSFKNASGAATSVSPQGQSATGVVSVGKANALRQIQNVAAGRVSKDSTDAVNGSQLYTVMENVGFNIYENAAAKSRIDNNNKVTFADGNFTKANVSGTSDATVKFNVVTQDITSTEATKIANPTGTAGVAKTADVVNAINKAGFTLKANSETSGEAITNGDSVTIKEGKNINVTRAGSEITIKTADEVEFTSVKTGSLTATGPTNLNGGVSVEGGLAMNDGKITGLKAGTDKTDAVNVEQLDKVKEIAEKGWNVTIAKVEGGEAESASDTKVAPGDKVTHIAGKNIKLVQNGANITVSTTDKVNFSEVTADKTNAGELTATSATVNGPTTLNGTATVKDKLTAEKGATISGGNLEMSDNKITGLAEGVDGKDAVNVNQLKESGWKLKINDEEDTAAEKVNPDEVVTFKQGDNIVITREGQNVTVATSQTPTFTNLTTTEGANIGGKLDVAGPATFKDSVTAEKGATIKGGDLVMSDNKITGLAEGVDGKDAVNVDQLDKAKTELTEKGLKFKGENGEVIHKNLGEQLDIIGDGKNVSTTNEGGKIKITMSDTPSFTSLSTTEGANIGGDLNVSGSTTLGDTNVGGKGNTFAVKEGTKVDMGGNKISNVANGDISPNSTDAVNGAQIFALTGGQGAPDVAANYTTTITNPDGSTTTLEHKNVVVDENGKPVLVTYNVQDQKEHVTNSVITAINHMNTQGIKFFHTNDGTAKAERPADQSENNEDSSASGAYATAVGYRATASGERAIAFGHNSTVTGTDSISVGTGNIVNGNNSGAFGDPSIIDADKSYSIGNDNRIAQGQSDVFVLGNNVTKTESNSVFLGTQSGYVAEGETTKGNSAHTSQTIGGETYQYAGGEASQVKGVVSVGNVAQDGTMETRRIQNVAPGLISAKSTDAINGSQLYALHSVIDKGWNLTSGTVEGSNGVSNQSAPAKVGMGETVRVNAGQNIVVNQNGRTLDIATTMAPNFNSLTVNPNGKVDMGGNHIQNVGQAINAGDAVNYGQLKAELGKVDNRLRSGVAGAVASASLVQAFNPSESMLAVGGGTYRGASALAVGYSKVSDNGKIIIKVTGSANNQGDYTGGASVGFKF